MNIEDKLDEDFLFYLGFTSSVVQKLKECDKPKAQQWLQKLCGEACKTVTQKRNRNIFLSNLLLDLQENQLTGPFALNPDEITFDDAGKYFPALESEVVTPAWLKEAQAVTPPVDAGEGRVDGRTYVATRTLPGGEGAFAYVAVSMSDEPLWLGGGEGAFDKAMHAKYQEYVPPQSEMEKILARRKDVHERQKVITFYEVTLQNIADELDGKISSEDNQDVNGLLNQLVADLQSKGQFDNYAAMCDRDRRIELLILLYSFAERRKRETQTREEVLDTIGAELHTSFFEGGGIAEENKYELPADMWEFCINRPPGKHNLDLLRQTYPPFVVEKFLELMANMKEEIARNMQRRHVNVISQMKQELQIEGDKLKRTLDDRKKENDELEAVLKEVRAAHERQMKSQDEANKRLIGGRTELTSAYEQMDIALKATQAGVEQESNRGHVLVEQINAVNAQTEMYNDITEKTIMMTEEANMELMKNIKRLRTTVKMNEARLTQILQMQQLGPGKDTQSQKMFIV